MAWRRYGPDATRDLDYVLTVDPRDTVREDVSIVVEDDRIAAIGPSAAIEQQFRGVAFERVIDGRRTLAMPGFVDAHLHLSEELSGSLLPDDLSTRAWVFNWAKPYYAAVNEEDEYVSALWAWHRDDQDWYDLLPGHGGAERSPLVRPRRGAPGSAGHYRSSRRRPQAAEIPPYGPRRWCAITSSTAPTRRCACCGRTFERWNGHAGGRLRCWVNIEGKEPCSPELHVGRARAGRAARRRHHLPYGLFDRGGGA